MKVQTFDRDVDWVAGLDLTDNAYGVRDASVQLVRVHLPELGWIVHHWLAPRDYGFWWLRDDYYEFRDSLGRVFNVMRGGDLDEPSVRRFDQAIEKWGIRRESLVARLCFGIYPRLWGDRFGPKRIDGRIFGRYFTVATPSEGADAVEEYFQRQLVEFDINSVKAVGERSRLYYTGAIAEYQRLLLLAPISMLSEEQAALVEQALAEVVADHSAIEAFSKSLDPRIAFAGVSTIAVDGSPPDGRAARVAELRVMLLCALGWPHALDYARRDILAAGRTSLHGRLLARIDEALNTFPVVRNDPLVGLGQWHGA